MVLLVAVVLLLFVDWAGTATLKGIFFSCFLTHSWLALASNVQLLHDSCVGTHISIDIFIIISARDRLRLIPLVLGRWNKFPFNAIRLSIDSALNPRHIMREVDWRSL